MVCLVCVTSAMYKQAKTKTSRPNVKANTSAPISRIANAKVCSASMLMASGHLPGCIGSCSRSWWQSVQHGEELEFGTGPAVLGQCLVIRVVIPGGCRCLTGEGE